MASTTDLTAPRTATTAPASRRSWSIVPLLTRLHFYTGILVAPFLAVAAITGLLFAFTPQLDNLVYATQLHTAHVGPGLLLLISLYVVV